MGAGIKDNSFPTSPNGATSCIAHGCLPRRIARNPRTIMNKKIKAPEGNQYCRDSIYVVLYTIIDYLL